MLVVRFVEKLVGHCARAVPEVNGKKTKTASSMAKPATAILDTDNLDLASIDTSKWCVKMSFMLYQFCATCIVGTAAGCTMMVKG